jgi:D-serine deaminase-like pyridoxal phosphate-dependent protein
VNEVGLRKTELDTPVLWVDVDQLESNITCLAEYFCAAGVGWRPHVKGIKVPAIAHKAIAAGAIGVTCAKVSESEVMAAAGVQDILIANQIVGPKKIVRLVNLQRHADVKVVVDNKANVARLGQAAQAKGVELGVLVEVDVGMHRAGVAPGQAALDLSRLVHQTPGLRYRGLMAWEGHARAITDPDLRKGGIREAVHLLTESAALCVDDGLPVSIVSAGGSGTYHVTAFQPAVTEVQAGGAIFSDVACQRWEVDTQPSLFVRSMVTSRPAPDRIIFDAGFKSLPNWFRAPAPVGLPPVKKMSMSAEHGVFTLESPDSTIDIGDVFDFIVGYGDSTLFLHDDLYGVRDGIVEVVWDIQGQRKIR